MILESFQVKTCKWTHTMIIKLMDYFSANLLLQDTIERIHVGEKYGDIPRGIFLVRGENMVLVGEIVRTEVKFIIITNFQFHSLLNCSL